MSKIAVINDNIFLVICVKSLVQWFDNILSVICVKSLVQWCAPSEKYLGPENSPLILHNDLKSDGVQLSLVSFRFVALYAMATWISFKISLLWLIQQWSLIVFFCHLRCRVVQRDKSQTQYYLINHLPPHSVRHPGCFQLHRMGWPRAVYNAYPSGTVLSQKISCQPNDSKNIHTNKENFRITKFKLCKRSYILRISRQQVQHAKH